MNCPKCNKKAYIIETRHADNRVIRRQWCKYCNCDFITAEDYVDVEVAKMLLKEGRDNVVRSKHV